ncbi:hypothetical protein [Shewanella maritima]|uniref:hypothetical protein n=1 Tax=Shewanella maritima TaxID=2520507 RepID=UPI0037366E04
MIKLGVSLLMIVSSTALAEVQVQADGTIETVSCAYGRGSTAIAVAKAQGTADIAAFVQGNKSLASHDANQQLQTGIDDSTVQMYEQNRSLLLEGLSMNALQISTSSPTLSGNDTCVTVGVAMHALSAPSESEWADEIESISVTVTGEGWPKSGQTARYHAEMDALQRAVSQVVGVWLSQQHSQSSQMSLQLNNGSETTNMQEFIGHQLSTHTEGLVKEWQTLDAKPINNDGLRVTVHAVVDKAPLIKKTSDLLDVIGSPRVKVIAPEPLYSELSAWLGQQGIEVEPHASLVIQATSNISQTNNTSRLHLSVAVNDLNGNQYGHWKNNPALIALPSNSNAEYNLMSVHLAHEEQSEALQASLKQAFTQVVARGGIVRQLWLPQSHISQPEKLQSMLSTLGGVSDVAIGRQGRNIVASMRFKGATGELAQAIHQMFNSAGVQLPAINIENDFTLRYQ